MWKLKVFKYTIFPCKGGYLLNVYKDSQHGEAEVFTSFMTLLTRIADLEGELDDTSTSRGNDSETKA